MPIYEYQCPKCQNKIEDNVPMKNRDKEKLCKKCSEKMQRIISCTSFILKGNGWYATDYKNNTSTKKEKK